MSKSFQKWDSLIWQTWANFQAATDRAQEAEAEREFGAITEACSKAGLFDLASIALTLRAEIALASGRLDSGERLLNEALAQPGVRLQNVVSTRFTLTKLLRRRGDENAASDQGVKCVELICRAALDDPFTAVEGWRRYRQCMTAEGRYKELSFYCAQYVSHVERLQSLWNQALAFRELAECRLLAEDLGGTEEAVAAVLDRVIRGGSQKLKKEIVTAVVILAVRAEASELAGRAASLLQDVVVTEPDFDGSARVFIHLGAAEGFWARENYVAALTEYRQCASAGSIDVMAHQPGLLFALIGIAKVCGATHDYPAAERAWTAIPEVLNVVGRSEHKWVKNYLVTVMTGIAQALDYQYCYVMAREYYKEALRFAELIYPDEHFERTFCRFNLAELERQAGDRDWAYREIEALIKIERRHQRCSSRTFKIMLRKVAEWQVEERNVEGAIESYRDLLAQYQEDGEVGHPSTITTMVTLGGLLDGHEEDGGEELLNEALRLARLGSNTASLVHALVGLSRERLMHGAAREAMALLREAEEILRTKLDFGSEQIAHVLETLILAQFATAEPVGHLLASLERLATIQASFFAAVFRSGSIGSASRIARDMRNSIGRVLWQIARDTNVSVGNKRRAYAVAQQWKGAEQKAFRLRNDSGKERRTDLERRVADARARLAQLIFNPVSGQGTAIEEVRARLASDTHLLASSVGEDRIHYHVLTPTIRGVAGELKPEEVLVDVWAIEDGGGYVAFRLDGANIEFIEVQWLGSLEEIDALVHKVIAAMEGNGAESVCREAGSALVQRVLGPRLCSSKSVRRLLYSPDGNLWRLPLDMLSLDTGVQVIDRFATCTLLSGREAFIDSHPRGRSPDSVVVAAPDFAATSHTVKSQAQNAEAHFPQLPESAVEGAAVAQMLAPCVFLKGAEATKQRLLELQSPLALHVATHGFFAEHAAVGAANDPASFGELVRSISEPLLRCGLALAGADGAVLGRGRSAAVYDSILWGADILELDVRGTEIVFLSACQTGQGETALGAAATSLAQSFWLAGARSVISTHWPLDDEAARAIAISFYQYLKNRMPMVEALRQARLDARAAGYSPLDWGAFSLFGERLTLQFGKKPFIQMITL